MAPKKPKPQPMLSDADMALLARKYARLGFKEGMSLDELHVAMDRLAEQTPLSRSNEEQAGKILHEIEDSMMAAVDAVKKHGTADLTGAVPKEVRDALKVVRRELKDTLSDEDITDRDVLKASQLVLEFEIREKGLQERADAQAQVRAPSRDMNTAIKQAGAMPGSIRGGIHHGEADELEAPLANVGGAKARPARDVDNTDGSPARRGRRDFSRPA